MLNESNNNSGFFQYAKDWMNENPGKTLGIIAGLVIAILLVTVGIGKTILVAILVGIGYFLGRSRDENVSIMDEISRIFKRDEPKE